MMSAFNLEMNFTNSTFNIFGMMDFPKDVIGLSSQVLFFLMAYFALKCLTHILDRRANLNVENNGFHLRANFSVDTKTNGRVIPNIIKQIPIRPRRPLR